MNRHANVQRATPEDLVSLFEDRLRPLAALAESLVNTGTDSEFSREMAFALACGMIPLWEDYRKLSADVGKWMGDHRRECPVEVDQ